MGIIKKHLSWSKIERIMRFVEFIAVLTTALVIPIQINYIKNQQNDIAFEFLIRLEDRMYAKNIQALYYNLGSDTPLLKKDGGNFEEADIDQYLDNLTSVEYAYKRKLIDQESLSSWFFDYFLMAYNNDYIKKYLIDIRKDGTYYYKNFEKTAEELIEYRKNLKE
jgi:hypothetical protein